MKMLFFVIAILFVCTSYANDIENVVVTTQRPYYYDTLQTIFPQHDYGVSAFSSQTHLNHALLQSPSVSLNGQGGQLQNVNLRGFSRWRIQTLVNGVPIVSDRRAGASIGFLPPDFVESVFVLPGAASTFLGSGAIGGAIDMRLSAPQDAELNLHWDSNQRGYGVSWVNAFNDTDWKISHRQANSGEDAQGHHLNNQFSQTALFARHYFEQGPINEIWSLYSVNRDVGKSSSDFPNNTITHYPDYSHWLGKLNFTLLDANANVWWHRAAIDTDTLRVARRFNESQNHALDFGFDVGNKASINNWKANWQLRAGGRYGVNTQESEYNLNQDLVYNTTTLDADEITLNGLLDLSRTINNTGLAFGTSAAWQHQKHNTTTATDTNFSAFAGVSQGLSQHWSASLYVSSAYRVPTLTERFYSGETPRGRVLGDPLLKTEHAVNWQGTLSYKSALLTGYTEVFYQRISDYIERISLMEELLQYSNVDSATVSGLNYQINWHSLSPHWHIGLSGAWTKGETHAEAPLQDIPPHKHRLDINYRLSPLNLFASLNYRMSKQHIADNERRLSSVFTLDMGGEWQMSDQLAVTVRLLNITNQVFYTSADDRAPFAQGKTLQVSLRFSL